MIILDEDSYVVSLMFADNKRAQVDVLAVLYRPKKTGPYTVTYRFRHRSDGGRKNWYEMKYIPDVEQGKVTMQTIMWALKASAKKGGARLQVDTLDIESGDRAEIVAKMKACSFLDAEEVEVH